MTDIFVIFPAIPQPPINGWPTQAEKHRALYLLSVIGAGNVYRWLGQNKIQIETKALHHKAMKIHLERLVETRLIYKFINDHEGVD